MSPAFLAEVSGVTDVSSVRSTGVLPLPRLGSLLLPSGSISPSPPVLTLSWLATSNQGRAPASSFPSTPCLVPSLCPRSCQTLLQASESIPGPPSQSRLSSAQPDHHHTSTSDKGLNFSEFYSSLSFRLHFPCILSPPQVLTHIAGKGRLQEWV